MVMGFIILKDKIYLATRFNKNRTIEIMAS